MKTVVFVMVLSIAQSVFANQVQFIKGNQELKKQVQANSTSDNLPIDIGSCREGSEPLYMLLWGKPRIQKAIQVEASIPYDQLQIYFDKYKKEGYSPLHVTNAYSSTSADNFTVIFAKNFDSTTIIAKGFKDFEDQLSPYKKLMPRTYFHPTSIAASAAKTVATFHTLFNYGSWNILRGLSQGQLQKKILALNRIGVQPLKVNIEDFDQYILIVSEKSTGHRQYFQYSSVKNFEQDYINKKAAGYDVYSVDCGGDLSSNYKIGIVYSKSESLDMRKFSAAEKSQTTNLSKELYSFMSNTLATNATNHGVIAVTQKGRLVSSVAANYIYQGYTPINTDAPMRVASLTKPMTALAIAKLVEQGKLNYQEKVMDIIKLTTPTGRPVSPIIQSITVANLINHSGGWDRSVVSDLNSIPDIAKKFNKVFPVTILEMIRSKLEDSLQFQPGTKIAYSNFGYSLLGRVIEKKTGQTYPQAMQELVFKPLGITKADFSSTGYIEGSKIGEPRYTDIYLRSGQSYADNTGAELPFDYNAEGDFRLMDSFGGLRLRMVDYAKVLATLSAIESAPTEIRNSPFKKTTVQSYFSAMNNKFPERLKGMVLDKAGGEAGISCRAHGGAFGGLTSYTCLRTDGIGVVMAFSKGGTVIDTVQLHKILSKEVPLVSPNTNYFSNYGL